MTVPRHIIFTPNPRLQRPLQQRAYRQFSDDTQCIYTPLKWCESQFYQLKSQKIHHYQYIPCHASLLKWFALVTKTMQHPEKTATQAKKAWDLLHEYQLTDELAKNKLLFDRQFLKWYGQYQRWLDKACYIDTALLPEFIIKNIQHIKLPEKIILFGFDFINPQIKQLLKILTAYGCIVEKHTPEYKNNQALRCIAFDTPNEELTTALQWAAYQSKQNKKVAVVVPDLLARRQQVIRQLKKITQPSGTALNDGPDTFFVSGGTPLIKEPIIADALLVLTLLTGEITLANAVALLLSPFVLTQEGQRSEQAVVANELVCNVVEDNITIQALAKQTAKLQTFSDNIKRIQQLSATDKKPLAHWCELFNQALTIMGWTSLTNLNEQQIDALQLFLNQLLTQDTRDTLAISVSRAVQTIAFIATQTLFSAKMPASNLNVLGCYEALMEPFDALWLVGATADVFPANLSPNPYIPFSLQKNYQLPGASSSHEYTEANILCRRFKQFSQQTYFSFASSHDSGEKQPSVFLSDIVPIHKVNIKNDVSADISHTLNNLSFEKNTPIVCHTSQRLNVYVDKKSSMSLEHTQPPLSPLPTDVQAPPFTGKIKGGSSVLQNQAACPFKAFAINRLGIKPLNEPLPLFHPLIRGTLSHRVLELFWQNHQNRQQLKILTTPSANPVITTIIDKTLKEYFTKKELNRYQAFFNLEKQRLHQLMQEYLAQESLRPPFTVIACESQETLALSDLTLRLTLDRLDELENKTLLLIDYKTGQVSIQDWLDERIDAPQLPLYTLNLPSNLAGIAYLRLKAGEIRYQGISGDDLKIKGIKTLGQEHWQSLRATWQQSLSTLAAEFTQGIATVTPKTAKSCQNCPLPHLCRIEL